ncbi:MAG: hypothetical protein ABI728_14370 [Betaproteobacteria bacterium]
MNRAIELTMQTLSSLSFPSLYLSPPPKWIAVRQRFEQFHRSLSLTLLQQQDAYTKYAGVVGCLNRRFFRK